MGRLGELFSLLRGETRCAYDDGKLLFYAVIKQCVHRRCSGEVHDHVGCRAFLQSSVNRIARIGVAERVHAGHDLGFRIFFTNLSNNMAHAAAASV